MYLTLKPVHDILVNIHENLVRSNKDIQDGVESLESRLDKIDLHQIEGAKPDRETLNNQNPVGGNRFNIPECGHKECDDINGAHKGRNNNWNFSAHRSIGSRRNV
ncbi:MAG: hypothetical protein IH859_07260 [Chloroflexi bacterium]|nr:hypothetical protein [Chloroflexota bacterium]